MSDRFPPVGIRFCVLLIWLAGATSATGVIFVNGWSNAIVPPGYTADHFDNVRTTIGDRATAEGVRLEVMRSSRSLQ